MWQGVRINCKKLLNHFTILPSLQKMLIAASHSWVWRHSAKVDDKTPKTPSETQVFLMWDKNKFSEIQLNNPTHHSHFFFNFIVIAENCSCTTRIWTPNFKACFLLFQTLLPIINNYKTRLLVTIPFCVFNHRFYVIRQIINVLQSLFNKSREYHYIFKTSLNHFTKLHIHTHSWVLWHYGTKCSKVIFCNFSYMWEK